MLNLYRRHLKRCPNWRKGRKHWACNCPIWVDGNLNGREYRRSLRLRDWKRAQNRLAEMESPGGAPLMPVPDAIETWKAQLDIEPSTARKYRNVIDHFSDHCAARGVGLMVDVQQQDMDSYRATRTLARSTWTKELQTLRQFLGFCCERRWIPENYAKRIKAPKWRPNEVVPYTLAEVVRIIAACDGIGQEPYERARARAMVLVLRYTGLRISDVALLSKDRINDSRIFLHTQKTGGQVFLPVPAELEAALGRLPFPYRQDGKQIDSGYFFWNGITSKRAAVGCAERTLAAVFRHAEIPGGHAHRFRHTLATSILAAGGTLADVSDVLGISEYVARRHYAKWTVDRQKRIDNLMAVVLKGTYRVHAEKTAVTQ